MKTLLLRLFVPNWQDKEDPAVRTRIGKLSGATGIGCNIFLFIGKLVAAVLSGSVSVAADAMNNLSDAASSVITLVGFRLAEKPADRDHPYGHARYEYLSGLTVAAVIIVIGFELAKTAVDKILHPAAVDFSLPVVLVLLSSIGVKLWMCLFNRSLGKHIGSSALLATAADSRNDVIATATVLLAGVAERLTNLPLDGIMGLAVALFVLYSGAGLAKETISPLLGEAASPELQKKITDIVENCPLVLGYHDLMVHDYGPGQRFASLHVEMDRREDPLVCHELIDDLERECLQKHNVHLVIHYDPIVTDDPEVARRKLQVQQTLEKLDCRLHLHDFRMVPGSSHINLLFDVVLPPDLIGQEETLRAKINEALNEQSPEKLYAVICFDLDSFNPVS